MSKYITSVLFVLISEIALQAQTLTDILLPGEMPTSLTRTETSTQNILSTGLNVASEFDDNALNDNRAKQANLLTLVEPHVGWSLSSPRATWMLSYRPGFSFGHPLSLYDSRSQLFDTNLQLSLTKRLQFRVRESLLQSKNIFDQLQQSQPASASSVIDIPNNSILAAARENNEQAGADISYALSARSSLGVGSAFYRVSYNSALESQVLASARSLSAHAFASYRLSKHHWVGFDYNAQDLTSQQPQSHSLVHSVLYTDTVLLQPTMSFSFFIGPQHSLTSGEPEFPFAWTGSAISAQANWSWAGGANYIWSSARTNVTLALARRISDGAGLQGIVQLSSASAEVRRQLTKRWRAQLLLSDNRNSALVPGPAPVSYVSFAGGFSRALNQRLSIEFQYWHVHETGSATPATTYLADHNRISLSLQYDLKVPLQR